MQPESDHAATRAAGHLDFVTGLRGLAAAFVLSSHVWYQIWPAVAPPYGYGRHPEGMIAWLTGLLYYGHFGVVVFIVLSGFCLMLPVLDNGGKLRGGVLRFAGRRARRILPSYYCAMAFSLLLIYFFIGEKSGSQWDISIPVTTGGLVSHLLLLQDFIDTTQVNYVFWSIAVEVQLYLMFPLLAAAWMRFGAFKAAASFCAAIYGAIAVLELCDYQDIPPQFIGLCAHFVLGMACATLLRTRNSKWLSVCAQIPWGSLALAMAFPVVVLCGLWGSEVAERRFAILDLLCALATVSLLLGAAGAEKTASVRSVLENGVLIRIGIISYSLYLIHAPLLQLVWQYAILPLELSSASQFGALLIFGVPASLLAGYLFFLLCERPFCAPSARRWPSFKPIAMSSAGAGRK